MPHFADALKIAAQLWSNAPRACASCKRIFGFDELSNLIHPRFDHYSTPPLCTSCATSMLSDALALLPNDQQDSLLSRYILGKPLHEVFADDKKGQ